MIGEIKPTSSARNAAGNRCSCQAAASSSSVVIIIFLCNRPHHSDAVASSSSSTAASPASPHEPERLLHESADEFRGERTSGWEVDATKPQRPLGNLSHMRQFFVGVRRQDIHTSRRGSFILSLAAANISCVVRAVSASGFYV